MRIIQFLNCDIKSITEQLDSIKKQNFDTIQINPVQPFIDVDGYDWWATYQPLDFKIGNIYGTKKDLIILCHEAKKRGLNVVVDVVSNHLANDGEGRETIPHRDIKEEIRNNKDFWKKHSKVYDFKSYLDVINESIGLPGLNLRNEELQDIVLGFLEDLKDCGVAGFRFDAAKHIGLPSDGVNYFKRVNEFLEKNNLFAYAEFLDGPSEIQEILNEKKDEFANLMYVLTEENSKVSDPSKKVTFVESHDTYLNKDGSTREKSYEEIMEEYVELTKTHENTLFYVRDNSRGVKLSGNNPDRTSHMNANWVNDERLRTANLNSGKERKESEQMKTDKELMDVQHNICMDMHDIMFNKLGVNSSIEQIVDRVIEDYKNQIQINLMVDAMPFDEFLMNCTVGEFYSKHESITVLNNIGYRDFYLLVLKTLKDKLISEFSKEKTEKKISELIKEKKEEDEKILKLIREKEKTPKNTIYGIG